MDQKEIDSRIMDAVISATTWWLLSPEGIKRKETLTGEKCPEGMGKIHYFERLTPI